MGKKQIPQPPVRFKNMKLNVWFSMFSPVDSRVTVSSFSMPVFPEPTKFISSGMSLKLCSLCRRLSADPSSLGSPPYCCVSTDKNP